MCLPSHRAAESTKAAKKATASLEVMFTQSAFFPVSYWLLSRSLRALLSPRTCAGWRDPVAFYTIATDREHVHPHVWIMSEEIPQSATFRSPFECLSH